jgi:regulator of replication initiation timing
LRIIRDQLVNILASLKPGLAKKDLIQQMSHFIFTGHDICTYNDRTCIIYPYETDFKCSVKGEELYKVLYGVSEDEVDMIVENNYLKIGSKKLKAGLSTLIDEKEKVEPMINSIKRSLKKLEFEPLPTNFLDGSFLCMFSTAKDMTKGVLNCVCYHDENIFSTDSLRVSHFKMNRPVKFSLIHFKNVIDMVKFPIVETALGTSWIHFKTSDGVLFNCRVLLEEYPEHIENYFNVTGKKISLPKKLKEVIETVTVLAEGEIDTERVIKVEIANNEIKCTAKKERGWIENSTEIEYKDKLITFYINPIFFAQILDRATDMVVEQNTALFVTETFKHVISLLPMEE